MTLFCIRNKPSLTKNIGDLTVKTWHRFCTPLQLEMIKKILIVDDEPRILRLLCLRMGKSYNPFPASDGSQAVEMAASLIPDLIIMDIAMPGMNGLEACRLIRQNPKTTAIPMLAASARVFHKDITVIQNSGFDDVIMKPFSYKDLVPHIEALLKGKVTNQLPSPSILASTTWQQFQCASHLQITEIDRSESIGPANCQRCQADEVSYHVTSDLLDVKVCYLCAHLARELETATLLAPKTKLPTWRQARRTERL